MDSQAIRDGCALPGQGIVRFFMDLPDPRSRERDSKTARLVRL